jgi:nitroreductase
MINETLKTIFEHRSIRKYKGDLIPEDSLQLILEAASRASTTGNMQVYNIVVTKDPELKKQLWECHFKQQMVLDAPVILTFCADFHRFNLWCKYRDAEPGYDNFLSFLTAAIDALLAAQNAAIAAESLGLGICYLGTTTYMAEKIAGILKCPDAVIPITTLTLGYPADTPGLTDRLPLEGIIHHETYHEPTRDDIDRIYAEKEALPLTKALLEENQLATLAQIFTQKRYTKKDNVFFSRQLLDYLERQNFMNHDSDK